ncbi:MAG: ATP-binding protein [Defluviitaleaceae bacterium]|nr:ATP-binding protein [Defluviitaleaceae bacterium]
MEKYSDPNGHLRDILQLYFKQTKENYDSEEFIENITEKEINTDDIFLPVKHIRNVFNIQNAKHLYIMVALSVLGQPLSDSEVPDNIEKVLLRRNLREIMDGEKLKSRVSDFILDPYTPISLHYLKYANNTQDSVCIEHISVELSNLVQDFIKKPELGIIWVTGRRGSGRKTHISYAMGNISVMFADIGCIAGHSDFYSNLEEIFFEKKLLSTVPCFYNIPETEANAFLNRVKNLHGLVFIVADYSPKETDIIKIAEIVMPEPDKEYSLRLWSNFIIKYDFIEPPDTEFLSENFKLTPLKIKQYLEKARAMSVANGENFINPSTLIDLCKKNRLKQLPILGKPNNICVKWADLILPQAVKEQLEQITNRITNRERVFKEWGFDLILPYGQGTTVLLEGNPGTGKTMAAYALAERIGLPMYKIDLSAIVSKYIGETEKNLQALFDEAAKADCILFFDEAEALFGKRTDVKDSKDKYANLEISFLLQRLEEHKGLTILATNLTKNFDDAFKRRFHFVIQFPLPKQEERELIWRTALPQSAPVSDDINYNFLAARYEISGSKIKNAALSTAFNAAAKGTDVTMEGIIEVLNKEITNV